MMSSQVSPAAVTPSGSVLWITPSQRDALQLLADGYTTNELSSRLGCAGSEIETVLATLCTAMDAATLAEAIRIAQKRGLLTSRA